MARPYGAVAEMFGRVPNSYRVLAHSPHVAGVLLLFNAVMQREGPGSLLPAKIKDMVVIKTGQVNDCAYGLAHNSSLGQAAGITDSQVEAIGSYGYMDSPHLSEREQAAVLWADHVTRNTARVRRCFRVGAVALLRGGERRAHPHKRPL